MTSKIFYDFWLTSGIIKNDCLDEWMWVLLSSSNLHLYYSCQLHSQPPTQIIIAKRGNCPDREVWRACYQIKRFKHINRQSPLILRSVTLLIIPFEFHLIITNNASTPVIIFTPECVSRTRFIFFSLFVEYLCLKFNMKFTMNFMESCSQKKCLKNEVLE